MPIFEYRAVDERGKQLKGSIDADTVRAARIRLRSQGLFPTEVHEGIHEGRHESKASLAKGKGSDVTRFFRRDRIGLRDLSISTRQLGTLVEAGLPLVNALQAISEQTASEVSKSIFVQVRERVEEGSSLAKALALFPRSFPRLYVNMVASGEASGTLDAVLNNLADYLEGQLELRRKIASALFYPFLMFLFCSLVVILLLTFVVPQIVDIFQKQGATLPLPTRILIGISNGLLSYWPFLLIAVLIAGATSQWYYRQPHGKEWFDHRLLKLPLVGNLYTKVATARIARTLGALLSSGVGLLTALEITRNIVGNVHISRLLDACSEGVREGRSLARELARPNLLPPMLSHMVAVGEQSGKLDQMLERAGKAYENDVNATISGLTSLIEPLMIITLGMIVFSIVIATLLPIMDLMDIMQK